MLQLLKRLGWGLEEGGVTFRGGEVWFFSFQVFFESRVKNRETKERSTGRNYDINPACETVGPLLTVCHVLETRLNGDLMMELSALIAQCFFIVASLMLCREVNLKSFFRKPTDASALSIHTLSITLTTQKRAQG